ncbi:MAG: hypothetical protein AB8B49_06855 [Nitratireductor sp.]
MTYGVEKGGGVMKFKINILAGFTVALMLSSNTSFAITDGQAKGLYRHGIWEWSIKTCPGVYRGKRYWYHLKEAAGFNNVADISKYANGKIYQEGWGYMQANADKFGIDATCDYAMKQWPAMLWRQDVSGKTEPVKEQKILDRRK